MQQALGAREVAVSAAALQRAGRATGGESGTHRDSERKECGHLTAWEHAILKTTTKIALRRSTNHPVRECLVHVVIDHAHVLGPRESSFPPFIVISAGALFSILAEQGPPPAPSSWGVPPTGRARYPWKCLRAVGRRRKQRLSSHCHRCAARRPTQREMQLIDSGEPHFPSRPP